MPRADGGPEPGEDLLPNAETALAAAAGGPAGPPRAPGAEPAAESPAENPAELPAEPAAELVAPARRPRRRAAARPLARPGVRPGQGARDRLTIEQIVGTESPREFRLAPDGRRVAYTAEAAGARQIHVANLRTAVTRQLTASEKNVSDPQWSPDGERLAFVRGDALWVVGADGTRPTKVIEHPAGLSAPRWAPDGRRLAFVSRRRGWSQVWLIDAPIPRRGRPPARPVVAEPRPLTPSGVDVTEYAWSPDGSRLAVAAQRSDDLLTAQVHVLDVATGEERQVSAPGAWEASPRWLPDGFGLLLVSDADGWFQVVRVGLDGRERTLLTSGPVEHGHYIGGFGFAPLPSPDGTRFVHVVGRDGFFDLVVAPLVAASPAKRGPGRPRKSPPPAAVAGAGARINPFDGCWLAVDWLPDGSGVVAIGESEREPEDLWILPLAAPGEVARPEQPAGAQPGPIAAGRPRRLTHSLPSVVPARGFVESERLTITARDGLVVPLTLWRPAAATGKRGGTRVPTIVHAHGGPTSQVMRDWQPFRQLLVHEGFAFVAVDFRGSTGLGRAYRWANLGEWGHADVRDVVDAARWAAAQPWSDGRLAVYGGSYGGYLALCALVEEPALWKAGVDLFGDSEIAESYRHGDRAGRLDLRRMMGDPDDAARAPLYRRGSPLYRAERIEAPLLILHGRKDMRVAPLMSEKMVEALTIEGKHHEVHWYDDEAHGWERRENRRDAFGRIVAFLRRHVLDEPKQEPGPRERS